MTRLNVVKRVTAMVLILLLIIPQIVSASPRQEVSSWPLQTKAADKAVLPAVKQGEIIFKTDGRPAGEVNIIKKYSLNVIRRDKRLGYVLAAVPRGRDVDKLVNEIRREKSIRYAQPNYIYSLAGRPNDPQYSRQWAMPKIRAEQGWGAVKQYSQVIMAILDSGVDVNHPDLKNRLVPGTNTVNPLKSTRDDDGHGTHVAGIGGAISNNGTGVAGVAGVSGVRIMPVKVFDGWGASDITISDGIIWAADHGARVMNMSFGSYYRSDVLNDAIDYAYEKGVVMVAAAGNWASEEISYPAALAKVIAVSATDREDGLADFSSYGPQIDVCAPGDEIYSTFWDPYKGSTYTEMSGTSMASPMVAGLAALLLSKNPKLTNEDVRQILEVSATDLGDPGWDPMFGHGRIDVYKALTLSLARYDDGNSTLDKAVDLTDGRAYREKIHFGTDVDWYRISVPEGSHLQVEVLPAGKVSPAVEIYDSAGAVISSFNTPDSEPEDFSDFIPLSGLKVAEAVYGLVTDLEQGDYFIKVFGNHFRWSEEEYSVTARIFPADQLFKDLFEPNDSYENAKTISQGVNTTGSIIKQGDEDWFKIYLSGGAYKVYVDVPDGLDLAVDVESQSNYENSQSFDTWFSKTINSKGQGKDEDGVVVLSGSGFYYIRVYDTGRSAVNAGYTLSISRVDFRRDSYEVNDTWEQAPGIKPGEDISANMHREEDIDWYRVSVPSTGILEVTLHQPVNAWYQLDIYDNPEDDPVGGDFYEFEFGPPVSPDPEKRSTTAEVKVTRGDYYIRVYNYGTFSAENYILKTVLKPFDFVDAEINDKPSQACELQAGVTRYGTLYPSMDLDFYVLQIDKSQPYLVYLSPPADLDTAITVFREMEDEDKGVDDKEDSEGLPVDDEPDIEPLTLINTGDRGQPDTGVFIANKPGRYFIMVMAHPELFGSISKTKSTGIYGLTVKPFKPQPDAWEENNTMAKARPLADGASIRPTFMGIEDIDWFKIYVPGKGRLNVSLNVPGDIDGVVEIYDSAGKLAARSDVSMVGEEEFLSVPISKSGVYYIKTYDYLGNSSVQPYNLAVRYFESNPPRVTGTNVSARTVRFRVSENARVWVKVLNSKDEFVAMMLDGPQVKAGPVTASWNGKDAAGRLVKPGIYKVKIVAMDSSGNMSKSVYTTIKVKI